MTGRHYVIVGNGVAGITAAQELRTLDQDGKISIISNEDGYYYRASLSEWISNRNTKAMMAGRTPEFYNQMKINFVTGDVREIDVEERRVWIGKQSIAYDKLLIASGASANRIPIPGLEDSLVFRSFQDAQDIKTSVGCCNRFMILGGGVLGLELSGALHQCGVEEIAVVQLMDHVGGPLLDERAAEWVEARMRKDGIRIFLGDTIERVEKDMAWMKSGATWKFNQFVQAVGIRPQFPEIQGLETGRGIRIDDHGCTNLPNIFAAGDRTETYDPQTEKWRTTRVWLDGARQGRAAAHMMTGNVIENDHPVFFNASLIYTERYAFIGDPHGEEGEVFYRETESALRKVRVHNGRLMGALLIGNRHGMMAMYEAVGNPITDIGPALASPGYAWNDQTGADWDYAFY